MLVAPGFQGCFPDPRAGRKWYVLRRRGLPVFPQGWSLRPQGAIVLFGYSWLPFFTVFEYVSVRVSGRIRFNFRKRFRFRLRYRFCFRSRFNFQYRFRLRFSFQCVSDSVSVCVCVSDLPDTTNFYGENRIFFYCR